MCPSAMWLSVLIRNYFIVENQRINWSSLCHQFQCPSTILDFGFAPSNALYIFAILCICFINITYLIAGCIETQAKIVYRKWKTSSYLNHQKSKIKSNQIKNKKKKKLPCTNQSTSHQHIGQPRRHFSGLFVVSLFLVTIYFYQNQIWLLCLALYLFTHLSIVFVFLWNFMLFIN